MGVCDCELRQPSEAGGATQSQVEGVAGKTHLPGEEEKLGRGQVHLPRGGWHRKSTLWCAR